MIYILTACMIMLFISALLVTARAVKGPTSLDRMVSVDMVSSILIGAVSLLAALTRRSDLLALFIVLALVGFVGSMTFARFITPRDSDAKIPSGQAKHGPDEPMIVYPDDDSAVRGIDEYVEGGDQGVDGGVDEYDPDAVDFSGTNVDTDDVMETGPKHDGATAAERREP